MVTIWDRTLVLRRGRRDLPERMQVDATTFGAAILAAERIFGVPIKPATVHDKYFIVGQEQVPTADTEPDSPDPTDFISRVFIRMFPPRPVPRCPPGYGNTDIHVERNGETFCPKHDLGFALIFGDVIIFDQLLC
jgi:hypothetical protein